MLLVEEFLTLILHLVSERYTVGIGDVTEEDCIKKDIIQLLCIEPMPHSVLNKALPEGVNHETGMEKVIYICIYSYVCALYCNYFFFS